MNYVKCSWQVKCDEDGELIIRFSNLEVIDKSSFSWVQGDKEKVKQAQIQEKIGGTKKERRWEKRNWREKTETWFSRTHAVKEEEKREEGSWKGSEVKKLILKWKKKKTPAW